MYVLFPGQLWLRRVRPVDGFRAERGGGGGPAAAGNASPGAAAGEAHDAHHGQRFPRGGDGRGGLLKEPRHTLCGEARKEVKLVSAEWGWFCGWFCHGFRPNRFSSFEGDHERSWRVFCTARRGDGGLEVEMGRFAVGRQHARLVGVCRRVVCM